MESHLKCLLPEPEIDNDSVITKRVNSSLNEMELRLEVQALKTKLTELEIVNMEMENELKKGKNTQNSPGNSKFDSQVAVLSSKFAQAARERIELENRLDQMKREHLGMVDKLEDNVRRISLQETDLMCQIRQLKTKIPELEERNNQQAQLIKRMKNSYTPIGASAIKELESQVAVLEEEKSRLESRALKLRREQTVLSDRLEQRNRQSLLEKTEHDSEIAKLKSTGRYLEGARHDLKYQLQLNKAKAKENGEREKEKTEELMRKIKELIVQNVELREDKSQVEKENEQLKENLNTLKEDLNARLALQLN